LHLAEARAPWLEHHSQSAMAREPWPEHLWLQHTHRFKQPARV